MTQVCAKMHIFINISLYVGDEAECWIVSASNLERSIKWCYTRYFTQIGLRRLRGIKYENDTSWIESGQ